MATFRRRYCFGHRQKLSLKLSWTWLIIGQVQGAFMLPLTQTDRWSTQERNYDVSNNSIDNNSRFYPSVESVPGLKKKKKGQASCAARISGLSRLFSSFRISFHGSGMKIALDCDCNTLANRITAQTQCCLLSRSIRMTLVDIFDAYLLTWIQKAYIFQDNEKRIDLPMSST